MAMSAVRAAPAVNADDDADDAGGAAGADAAAADGGGGGAVAAADDAANAPADRDDADVRADAKAGVGRRRAATVAAGVARGVTTDAVAGVARCRRPRQMAEQAATMTASSSRAVTMCSTKMVRHEPIDCLAVAAAVAVPSTYPAEMLKPRLLLRRPHEPLHARQPQQLHALQPPPLDCPDLADASVCRRPSAT